jgi:hypothetical protein
MLVRRGQHLVRFMPRMPSARKRPTPSMMTVSGQSRDRGRAGLEVTIGGNHLLACRAFRPVCIEYIQDGRDGGRIFR